MSLRYPRLTAIGLAMLISEIVVFYTTGGVHGWVIGLCIVLLLIGIGENPTTVPPKE